jgi:hypothetical protein
MLLKILLFVTHTVTRIWLIARKDGTDPCCGCLPASMGYGERLVSTAAAPIAEGTRLRHRSMASSGLRAMTSGNFASLSAVPQFASYAQTSVSAYAVLWRRREGRHQPHGFRVELHELDGDDGRFPETDMLTLEPL